MRLIANIFDLDRVETKGEYLFFRFFELLICYLVLYYAWTWGVYTQQLGEVVLPLGLANYFDIRFMFSNNISIINALIIGIFLILGLLSVNRYSYSIALLLFHFQYVARFSQGEISHGSNMVGMALLAFAVSAVFVRDAEKRHKIVLGMIIFFIGLGYTSAAFCKLIGTGPAWVDGRHLWLWIGERSTDVLSQTGSFEFNLLQEYALQYRWLATLILIFGLFTELAGFTFWFKKARPYIATLLIGMHFGILFSMNISFSKYVYIMILLGYPWPKFIDRLLQRRQLQLPNIFQKEVHG